MYKLIRYALQEIHSKFIHEKSNTSLMFEINPIIFHDFASFSGQLNTRVRKKLGNFE